MIDVEFRYKRREPIDSQMVAVPAVGDHVRVRGVRFRVVDVEHDGGGDDPVVVFLGDERKPKPAPANAEWPEAG